jgi:hypothetical protein
MEYFLTAEIRDPSEEDGDEDAGCPEKRLRQRPDLFHDRPAQTGRDRNPRPQPADAEILA